MVVIVTWRIKCHSRLASRWWYCARQLLIWSQWYLSLLAPLAISPHHTDILSLVPRPVTSVAGQKLPNLPFIRNNPSLSETFQRVNAEPTLCDVSSQPKKNVNKHVRHPRLGSSVLTGCEWTPIFPMHPNASKCVKRTKAAASRVKAEDHISIKMWSATFKRLQSVGFSKQDQTIHVRHARLTRR